jgi:multiple sugar transport system substrate-binding protein/putative aldouronate transport system substrate-binding protein
MKKKLLSLVACAALLAGCGSSNSGGSADTPASGGTTDENGEYVLETLNITVDGTVTATVDAGQAEFVQQW